MPVHNQERYIAAAVQSILSQTFRDFEFVIVDDGSTDRTVEIIESFKDKRIRLFRDDHKGFLAALRRACSEAGGEWLARMDSDDVCPSDRLAKQIAFLDSHPECIFLTTTYGIVTPNDKYLAPGSSNGWIYLKPSDITHGKKLFCDPGSIFQRKIALSLHYDDSLPVETPLWYGFLSAGKGVFMDEPLYYARWRLGSLSRGQMDNAREINRMARVRYDPENAGVAATETNGKLNLKNEKRAVYFCAAAGDYSAARKTAFAVWKRHPFRLVAYKLLLAASGLQRRNNVEGPCKTNFIPIPNPLEIPPPRKDFSGSALSPNGENANSRSLRQAWARRR